MAKRRARKQRKPRAKGAAKKRRARPRIKRATPGADSRSPWNPSEFAFWSQRWGDPNDENQTYPTIVWLRHPTAPFMATVTGDNFEHDLQKVAYDYLVAANNNPLINPSLELPGDWLDALDPDGPGPHPELFPSFGWLRIGWPTADTHVRPMASFVARRTNASEGPADLMVILLASQTVLDTPVGFEFGIRVVAHVRQTSQSEFEIRITGMSASLPFGPFRLERLPPRAAIARERRLRIEPKAVTDFLMSVAFKSMVANMLNLESDTVVKQGMRLSPFRPGRREGESQIDIQLNFAGQSKRERPGSPDSVNPEPYYSLVFATTLTHTDADGFRPSPLALVSKTALVAEAGPARIFPIDPASQDSATGLRWRRPTRSEVNSTPTVRQSHQYHSL